MWRCSRWRQLAITLIGYNLMYPLGTWSVEGVLSGSIPVAAVLEAVGVAPDKVDDISMRQPDQISSFS